MKTALNVQTLLSMTKETDLSLALEKNFFVDVAQHISRCPDVHLSDDDGGLAGAHHRGEVVSDGRSLLGLDTALEMEIQTLVLEGEQITTETVCYLTFNVDLECMTTVP